METEHTDLKITTDTNGFVQLRRWDAPSGNPDSTAIGDWRLKQPVYVLDRGYGFTGNHQGYTKIKFLKVDEHAYHIQFADLEGMQEMQFEIPKDSTYNFSFLSLANGGQLKKIEPPKSTWDLCFTQYLHEFHDPTTIYLVTGCLLNRFKTQAAVDSVLSFQNITYKLAEQMSLRNQINSIGFGWKFYANGLYTARPEINYIIKNQKGFYYKLHFIDFYSLTGQKGSPKWEFQRL